MTLGIGKTAIVLDDQSDYAAQIACGIRLYGREPVTYYSSIEALKKFLKDQNCDLQTFLENCSAIICDNHFGENLSYGRPFLVDEVAPLVRQMPPEKRPLVICFAPSAKLTTEEINKLWGEGILYFSKIEECPLIGLAVRFSKELGRPLSRQELVGDILGFAPETQARENRELHNFCNALSEPLVGNSPEVGGEEKVVTFNDLLKIISQGLEEAYRSDPLSEFNQKLSIEVLLDKINYTQALSEAFPEGIPQESYLKIPLPEISVEKIRERFESLRRTNPEGNTRGKER